MTAAEFTQDADPSDPDDQTMLRMMSESGLVSVHVIALETGGASSSAIAFRFNTPAGAAKFSRVLLTETCKTEDVRNARAIPALAGGMSFLDGDPDSEQPYSASFVAGDTVIAFTSCGCAKVPDNQTLVAQWAQVIASRVGAGQAAMPKG